MQFFGILLLVAFVTCLSTRSSAQPAELFSLIEQQKLYQKMSWTKLLFYTPKVFTGPRGFFDSPDTYLSPNGKFDAKAEMLALAKGLYEPVETYPDVEKHPICRFPARVDYLVAALDIDRQTIAQPPCKLFDDWMAANPIDRISLVFSSYYTDNPASMFGHTFVQLHRKSMMQHSDTNLLDLAVNYAAEVPKDITTFEQYSRGLAGKLPGRYSVMPFYVKVQEYNNFEQRDLWHYELNFTPQDLNRFMKILWELENSHAGYFYFDDNCSTAILMTIEAAKPEIELYNALPHPWIMPSDTLRTVYHAPGLVKNIEYTPSTRTKFLLRYQQINDDEKNLVHRISSDNQFDKFQPELAALTPERQAKILDALVELLDFNEDIAGADLGTKYKDLRRQLLSYRANIPVKATTIPYKPLNEGPHLGHGSTRFGLGGGYDQDRGNFLSLEWRPAFHDLLDRRIGFPAGLQIEFMHTQAKYYEDNKKLFLADFGLIKILSLGTSEWEIRSLSWTLGIGGQQRLDCGRHRKSLCWSHYADAGVGQTLLLPNFNIVTYMMLKGRAATLHDGYHITAIEPGFEIGAVYNYQIFSAQSYWYKRKSFTKNDTSTIGEVGLHMGFSLSPSAAVRVRGIYNDEDHSSLELLGQYFY